jgi:hypothetical protein
LPRDLQDYKKFAMVIDWGCFGLIYLMHVPEYPKPWVIVKFIVNGLPFFSNFFIRAVAMFADHDVSEMMRPHIGKSPFVAYFKFMTAFWGAPCAISFCMAAVQHARYIPGGTLSVIISPPLI